jgi:hypothetical protein
MITLEKNLLDASTYKQINENTIQKTKIKLRKSLKVCTKDNQ